VPPHPLPAPRPIRDGIGFDDVWFAYPERAEPVLRGLSFAIRPGESLALVGHNGAGKTTVVKLLLRLYDPTEGRITLDGADLREYDLESLRRHTGVIFQDFVRYELTARENLAVGDLEALQDDQRLLAAARKAGGDGLIRSLPRGLETQLGRRFGGRDLSGGEWQKLALARAFVRDCDLLVLDEPTASLDVQTEYEVYLRFQDLTQGRMTLLISHRFSTVRMAGRILYLDGGRIAEDGTHEALMRAGGEYARLYGLQASHYLETGRRGEGATGRAVEAEVRR
jgi:ATP-binding cassette subfamily B protein